MKKYFISLCILFSINSFASQSDFNQIMAKTVSGKNEEVKKLIEKKTCNLNQVDSSNHTPLWTALTCGNFDIARHLLGHGADVNFVMDDIAGAALHYAAYDGRLDIVEFLLQNGANIDSTSGLLQTPLITAASRGQLEVVRLLVQSGANINSVDFNGNGALNHALYSRNRDLLRFLLQSGANYPQGDEDNLIQILGEHPQDYIRRQIITRNALRQLSTVVRPEAAGIIGSYILNTDAVSLATLLNSEIQQSGQPTLEAQTTMAFETVLSLMFLIYTDFYLNTYGTH